MDYELIQCTFCEGTGHYPCQDCYGPVGSGKCIACLGTGHWNRPGYRGGMCTLCYGSGKCKYCKGTGNKVCTRCSGSGLEKSFPSTRNQGQGGREKQLEDAHHAYLTFNRPEWAQRAGILPPDPEKGCQPNATMIFLFVVLFGSSIIVLLTR